MALTPEQKAKMRAYNAKRYVGITVERPIRDALHEAQAKLTPKLGFKPTVSQTIQHLVNCLKV